MAEDEIKIVTLSSGEKANELADKISELVIEYSKFLTEFEIIGVLDILKIECYQAIMEGEEEG